MINQIEPWFNDAEKRAVIEYLNSGGWLTEYKKTAEFEAMLANYLNVKHCIALTNCTAALFCALAAHGIGPGDEVICPDYTFIASASAISWVGAKPVFVDISLSNLCLDLDLVEQSITPHTKAIMLVSLNGRSPDMYRANRVCRLNDLFLIEDAAQSLGSKYEGRFLGTFGHAGCFSFSSPKIITMGLGGILVTDDDEIADKVRRLKNFGRPFPGANVHDCVGYNLKITDLQAVIGMEQFKKLLYRISHKKGMYDLYRGLLADVDEVTFIDTDLRDTCPWLVDVLVPAPVVLHDYLESRGIGTRFMYPAIHSQPAYNPTYNREGHFPNSVYAAQHGLWLPSSSFLKHDQIWRICKEIREFYKCQR